MSELDYKMLKMWNQSTTYQHQTSQQSQLEQVSRISGFTCKLRKCSTTRTRRQNSTGSDYLQSDAAELKQLLEIEHF